MSNSATTKANKENHLKDLILLFAIPITIALIAAVAVYLPRLFANPNYDFIYSVCEDYNCNNGYMTDSTGYITQQYTNNSRTDSYRRTAILRYYDSSNDSTRSLTLEEARLYQLNTSSKSPDGYTLINESSSSGFLFWGDYDEGWYLKSGAKKKEVKLAASDMYYSTQIKFLGWINQ